MSNSTSAKAKITSRFDALAPQSHSIPRQYYGFDFYGVQGGEILVIVAREVILEWLPSRKQEAIVRVTMR